MSKYLDFGIAREVVASIEGRDYTYKEVIEDFFKTVDKNLYDIETIEDEKCVRFNLKDEMLLKYGINLIKEQYEKYIKPDDIGEITKVLDELNSKTTSEKMETLNDKSLYFLQDIKLGWQGFDAQAFFELPIEAYITDFLVYHDSSTTFMEEYSEFLKYTRNLLLNSTDNPLKTALTISI